MWQWGAKEKFENKLQGPGPPLGCTLTYSNESTTPHTYSARLRPVWLNISHAQPVVKLRKYCAIYPCTKTHIEKVKRAQLVVKLSKYCVIQALELTENRTANSWDTLHLEPFFCYFGRSTSIVVELNGQKLVHAVGIATFWLLTLPFYKLFKNHFHLLVAELILSCF